MQKEIDRACCGDDFGHVPPGRFGTPRIDQEPARIEIGCRQGHPDGALERPLVGVGEDVERGGHLVADRVAEKAGELAAGVFLQSHNQPVDGPHAPPDSPFDGSRFAPQVVEHRLNVFGDPQNLVERVAVNDQGNIVGEVGQRLHSAKQIPDRVPGPLNLAGERVESAGQVAAPPREAAGDCADLRQSVIDAVAALSGMAIVVVTWYGLHMFLALSAMKDLPSFIVD